MTGSNRRPQVCMLGSAEPGSTAYELAGEAGALLAKLGITVVSGCGSPATRVAAERASSAPASPASSYAVERDAGGGLARHRGYSQRHGRRTQSADGAFGR